MKRKRRSISKKESTETSNWEHSIRVFLASLIGAGGAVFADAPLALIGGETSSDAYAAFLLKPDGEVFPISGLPSPGVINAVGMNSLGKGLLGGKNDSDAYATFVFPDGTLTPLALSFSVGNISSVAINEDGLGLLGGREAGANIGYAAQVSSDGIVTPLFPPADIIEAVALNNSDVGLIGGEGSAVAYAAYVDAGGTVTTVPNMPVSVGHIYSVAINNLGEGIIGGISNDFGSAYAAFVTPAGPSPLVLTPLPSGFSIIYAAAINESGNGLIGGLDAGSNAYAGYAAPDGSVTTLFDTPFPGIIRSVALNKSGVGLIGGDNGSNPYAAFVSSNGALNPLFDASLIGTIKSVALSDAGLGLIGGQVDSEAYVALVAPNGALTPLNILNGSSINSVALQSQEILNQATPKSVGPYGSAIYTQLAAAAALNTRFLQQNRVWAKLGNNETKENVAHNEMNLAYNEFNPTHSEMDLALCCPKKGSTARRTNPSFKKNSIWVEPFGNFVHLKEQGSIPSFTNEVGGALLGYDRQGPSYIVGATLGYAFNYVGYSNHLGHAKLQEEMASLYGSYYTEHFWVAAALWGGLYQFTNHRHTLSEIRSKGKSHGWILSPHLELASPWAMDQKNLYYVEPFAQFDWVNNWQRQYTESGSSGLNLQVPSVYNSLLQSEIGLRFYERFVFGWGDFCLEEKVGYVNQAPFDVNSANTAFVSSASSFPIAVASDKMQNLGSAQILGCFVPRNPAYPYGGFSFQATVGSSYQSYFVSVFSGVDF